MRVLWVFTVAVAIVAVWLLYYMGFFYFPVIDEIVAGEYVFVYRKVTGPYRKGFAAMDEVSRQLRARDIAPLQQFGFYFDNPQATPEDRQRSISGCIIRKEDRAGLDAAGGFVTGLFGPVPCVRAVYPYKNATNIITGIFKVYPALDQYLQGRGYARAAVLEIYDPEMKTTTYLMPLAPSFDPLATYFNGPGAEKKRQRKESVPQPETHQE